MKAAYRRVLRVGCAALLLGCSGRQHAEPVRMSAPAETTEPPPSLPAGAVVGDAALQIRWNSETRAAPAPMVPLATGCRGVDARLSQVAQACAVRLAAGGGSIEPSDLAMAMRVVGSPYVWPKLWTLRTSPSATDTEQRARRWIDRTSSGNRLCGVGTVDAASRRYVALIAADALGELSPLPTLVRQNRWVTVEARLGGNEGSVIALGPSGAPRILPSAGAGDRLRASFAVDQPGRWAIQILVRAGDGPRPALEAWIHAGAAPETRVKALRAPGEGAASAGAPDERLVAMINAARRQVGLRSLRQHPDLNAVADRHVQTMLAASRIGHRLGTGSPAERVGNAGIDAEKVGENVARAASLARVHRSLWASPSHRGNLLDRRFTHIGVAVAESDGQLWVAQLFIAL